jgi:hypothetical protein
MQQFPAIRKWHKGATDKEFQTVIQPTQIYRAESVDPNNWMALHTVTICDLADHGFACTATGTLGAPGRVFYVSPNVCLRMDDGLELSRRKVHQQINVLQGCRLMVRLRVLSV